MRTYAPWLWALGFVALLGLLVYFGSRPAQPAGITNPGALQGLSTELAPWPADISGLRNRLSSIGLPALSAEGTVLHIHQHIDISVDGQPVTVPSGIGINDAARFISQIHVHDQSGIIHVESPTVQTFTLGQFFDIWGVRFSADCIGGYCAGGGKTLKVFSNGTLFEGDPRGLVLEPHQEIFVSFGTDEQLPTTTPSSYTFPAGY